MIVAHLPASYLLTQPLARRLGERARLPTRTILALGLLAGVLPDFDLVYFYAVDHRQHMHHTYWTHIPIFWVAASATWAGACAAWRSPRAALAGAVVAGNVFLHLLLDTVVGRIMWAYPYSDVLLSFTEAPARYSWWLLNFIFHWTFALELTLVAWAAQRLRGGRGRARLTPRAAQKAASA